MAGADRVAAASRGAGVTSRAPVSGAARCIARHRLAAQCARARRVYGPFPIATHIHLRINVCVVCALRTSMSIIGVVSLNCPTPIQQWVNRTYPEQSTESNEQSIEQ